MGKTAMMKMMIINLQIHVMMMRIRILMTRRMPMERQGQLRKLQGRAGQ